MRLPPPPVKIHARAAKGLYGRYGNKHGISHKTREKNFFFICTSATPPRHNSAKPCIRECTNSLQHTTRLRKRKVKKTIWIFHL